MHVSYTYKTYIKSLVHCMVYYYYLINPGYEEGKNYSSHSTATRAPIYSFNTY